MSEIPVHDNVADTLTEHFSKCEEIHKDLLGDEFDPDTFKHQRALAKLTAEDMKILGITN